MLFANKAKEEFGVAPIESAEMDRFVRDCSNIYRGVPSWVNEKKHIKTYKFAKFVCSETAKLSTIGLNITLDGDSERIKVLQARINDCKAKMREWVEFGAAMGTVILKPDSIDSVQCYQPTDYIVTEQKNGNITGVVFLNSYKAEDGKTYYTRLEYHRFVNDLYVITNRCYKGYSERSTDKPIPIEQSPWNDLAEEVAIQNIDEPLYGVLKMPSANNIDMSSCLGVSVFADAIEELKDLDVALSRNAKEIYDSKRTVLLDSDRLIPVKGGMLNKLAGWERTREQMELPDYVKNVMGDGSTGFYQEINPELHTDVRMTGINALLSQIGFKCGFSNGYFVFNESTGFATATQVTADQSRTIQFIDDVRTNLEVCIIALAKALNVFEDLYGTTGHIDILDDINTDELDRMIHIHAEPIYTNAEEDRARALQLTNTGYYPKWYYLHMYEGMSEEDAKALVEEAQPKEQGLFDE